jgi:hypothetical protein
MVNLSALAAYEPRWPGVVELNLQDEWRARWVDEQVLPANAPVNYAYAMVVAGERGYVVRRPGEKAWGMVEGATGDQHAQAFVEAETRARMGIEPGLVDLIGFFECKATRQNRAYPPGALTVRPLYLIVAKDVGDAPAGWERRRLPMNEFMVALRSRYPELDEYLGKAALRYAVLRKEGKV